MAPGGGDARDGLALRARDAIAATSDQNNVAADLGIYLESGTDLLGVVHTDERRRTDHVSDLREMRGSCKRGPHG